MRVDSDNIPGIEGRRSLVLWKHAKGMAARQGANVEAWHVLGRLQDACSSFVEACRANKVRWLGIAFNQGVYECATGGLYKTILGSKILCLLNFPKLFLRCNKAFDNLHVLQAQVDQFLENLIQGSGKLIRFDSGLPLKRTHHPSDRLHYPGTFFGNPQCHFNIIKADRPKVHVEILQTTSDVKLSAPPTVAKSEAAEPMRRTANRMPEGWWITPAVVGGALGWAAVIWAVVT